MTDNCGGIPSIGDVPLETGQAGELGTVEGLHREIDDLRASRARLASANDADRRDIERALHEGVQQDLVGLVANLEVVSGSVVSDPAAARALLRDLQREARRALAEVQELATRIFPSLLEAGGIVPELRAAASRAGVPASFAVELDGAVPTTVTSALYFCVLDVFERAPAGTPVEVRVRRENGALAFEVVADHDLGTARSAAHDRIEALGGRVTVTSEGDQTSVSSFLPFPR
jgi:signal transduction histidine kinase